MYWPEHWDKGLRMPPMAPSGAGDKSGTRGDGLLDAVIDNADRRPVERVEKPVEAKFPTRVTESRFKSCLARVPVDCRMERYGSKRVLALRPKNLQRFDELIRTSGLGDCETATRVIRWLRDNPSEYLRFESH